MQLAERAAPRDVIEQTGLANRRRWAVEAGKRSGADGEERQSGRVEVQREVDGNVGGREKLRPHAPRGRRLTRGFSVATRRGSIAIGIAAPEGRRTRAHGEALRTVGPIDAICSEIRNNAQVPAS